MTIEALGNVGDFIGGIVGTHLRRETSLEWWREAEASFAADFRAHVNQEIERIAREGAAWSCRSTAS